ncbi:MAG: AhpC/TSA family protein [Bacteroidota bacterium]
MKKLLCVLLAVGLSSCGEKEIAAFSLQGTVEGFEDGTVLLLQHNYKTIDSTTITNNTFSFHTKLTNAPIEAWLRVKDQPLAKMFWIENNPMTFDASKANFREATITGSETEKISDEFYKKIENVSDEESTKAEIAFVKTNPASIISASMLSMYATSWGIETTRKLYDQFSPENKNSFYGKEIAKFIELVKDPKIGEQYVDIALKDPQGTIKKLSDVQGKIILLEFWASWCGPCRKENPNLVNNYKKYHSEGFEIFAVSLDSQKKDWVKAIEKDQLTWQHVSDLQDFKSDAALVYGINSIPQNYLIAANGTIIARNLRGEKLTKKLAEIFTEKNNNL